jgi:hypothetical protein
VPNKKENSLSNISLRWMIQELVRADCGVLFDLEAFDRWHIPKNIAQTPSPSRSTSLSPIGGVGGRVETNGQGSQDSLRSHDSSLLDAEDVEQRINDQLKDARVWWLLEIIPTRYPFMTRKGGKWVKRLR